MPQRVGFSAIEGRYAKAQKIAVVLIAADSSLKPSNLVLDIGASGGKIAVSPSRYTQAAATDVVDQRTLGLDLPFVVARGRLPLSYVSCDYVFSNRVIDYSGYPNQLLREIHRVVRSDGLDYLATTSRWWPWQIHLQNP